MNRANEIRSSLSNIKYELDNDIYNPPKVKEDKPFNMSDYIKPVDANTIPDVEDINEIEQVAFEKDDVEIVTDPNALVDENLTNKNSYEINSDAEYMSSMTFAYTDNNQHIYGGFKKIATNNGDNYTEKLIKKNISNFQENVLNSDNKLKGIKDSIEDFKEDNSNVLDNAPNIAMDTAEFAISKMIPGANRKKKAKVLRNVAEDNVDKGTRLLGKLFAKRAEDIQEDEWEKIADYKDAILRRQRRYLNGRRY